MADCEKLFQKGREAALEKRFEEALKFYSDAIENDSRNSNYYFERSGVYLEMEKYNEAKNDVCKSIELGCCTGKEHFRKGVACYYLEQYQQALEAFSECDKLNELKEECISWIQKCKEKIQDNKIRSAEMNSDVSSSNLRLRYDWYQTETQVVITILLKSMKNDDVKVDFTESTLSFSAKLPSKSTYSLELDLAHPIVPQRSTYKIMSTKIEIKMQKSEGIRWTGLEGDSDSQQPKQFKSVDQESTAKNVCAYPSSRPQKKDWDKIVVDIKKEEEEEKPEGEAALNQLFQKIYAEGSDEVKKAMNKSFSESGGTVLSTNWKEVGTKKMDVKPPDGMEWKKWN